LINLTRRSIGPLGAEWRNEAVIGSTQALLSEFYQPLNHGGYFFVAPTVEYRSELQDVYDDKNHIAKYDVNTTEAKFDFGIQLRRYAELRVGPVWGHGRGKVDTGLAGLPEFDDDYVGPVFSLIVDRKDRTYFPRKGYYFETRGFFPLEEWGGDVSFDKVSAEFSLNQSIGEHTLEVGLNGGTALGSDLPGYAQFTLGGPQSFAGLAQDQFRGTTLGVASLEYRYRLKELPSQLGRGIYTLTRFDLGNVWEGDMNSDIRYGGSIGVGMDLNIGPLLLTYGVADGGYHSVYFSLGSDF
jgi:NTE family protein